jgi:sec-independent protein translocase protein TatA
MGLENPIHLLIIALVIVLLFGAKRLPELGRSLGSGLREFKGSLTGADDEDEAKPAVVEASATPAEPVATAPTADKATTPSSVGLDG